MAEPNISRGRFAEEQAKGRYQGLSFKQYQQVKIEEFNRNQANKDLARKRRAIEEAEKKSESGIVYVREKGQGFAASSYKTFSVSEFKKLPNRGNFVVLTREAYERRAPRAKPEGISPQRATTNITGIPSLPPGERRAVESGQAVVGAQTTRKGFVFTAATPRAAEILTAEAIEVQERRAERANIERVEYNKINKQIQLEEAQRQVKEQTFVFGGIEQPALTVRAPKTELEMFGLSAPIPTAVLRGPRAERGQAATQRLERFRALEKQSIGGVGFIGKPEAFSSPLGQKGLETVHRTAPVGGRQRFIEKGLALRDKIIRKIETGEAPEQDLLISQQKAREAGIDDFSVKLVQGAQKLPFDVAKGSVDIAFDVALTGAGLAFPETRKGVVKELGRAGRATPRASLEFLPTSPEKIIPFAAVVAGGAQLAKGGKPVILEFPKTITLRTSQSLRFAEIIRTPFGKKGVRARTKLFDNQLRAIDQTHTLIDFKPVGREPVVQVARGVSPEGVGVVSVVVKGDIYTQLNKGAKTTVITEPKIIPGSDLQPPVTFRTTTFGRRTITQVFRAPDRTVPIFQVGKAGRFKGISETRDMLQIQRDILQERTIKLSERTVTGKFDLSILKKLDVRQDIGLGLTRRRETRGTQRIDFERVSFRLTDFEGVEIGRLTKPVVFKGQRPELIFERLEPPRDAFSVISRQQFDLPTGNIAEVVKFSETLGTRIIKRTVTTPKQFGTITIQEMSRLPDFGRSIRSGFDKLIVPDTAGVFKGVLTEGKRGQIRLIPELSTQKVGVGQRLKPGKARTDFNFEFINRQLSRTRPSTRQRIIPTQRTEIESETISRRLLEPIPVVRSRIDTRIENIVRTRPTQIPEIRQNLVNIQQTRQRLNLRQKTLLKFQVPSGVGGSSNFNIRTPVTPTPPPPPPPPTPPFIFNFNFTPRRTRRASIRRGRRRFQYSADIASLFLGIERAGLAPTGQLTGLEARPIFTEPRRRKRKKTKR